MTEADNISYLQSTTNNIILLAASDEGDLFGIISAAALPNHHVKWKLVSRCLKLIKALV